MWQLQQELKQQYVWSVVSEDRGKYTQKAIMVISWSPKDALHKLAGASLQEFFCSLGYK